MRDNRTFLFFTVFMGGMTTLAIEFVASRMLQTVFGTSNIVWANVIGLVLLFLTLGYFIGGRFADRNPRSSYFYWLVTAAGFSGVFFLLLTSVLLRSISTFLAAREVGAVASSFVAVFFALAVPVTLLGCLSPFAIRLGVRNVAEAGHISGKIYAISTLGSLLGTYLPVLYVIPTAGSRFTALIFGFALMLTGVIGVWLNTSSKRLKFASFIPVIVLIPFSMMWTQGNIKVHESQIFETESQYNYVEVRRTGTCNSLLLNDGQVVHSVYCDGGKIPYYTIYTSMLAAPYFNDPEYIKPKFSRPVESLAMVGLGAGMVPKRFMAAFGEMPVDGIELDPEVIRVGKRYFDMNEPTLTAIAGDGRYELNRLKKKYDIIVLDAYKPPYIPWHLTTKEYFEEVKARLNEHGSVTINVFRPGDDRRLVEALTSTLLEVFSSVHTVDYGNYNTNLIATVQPTSTENFYANARMLDQNSHPLLRRAFQMTRNGLKTTKGSNIVFTDELAAVEIIIDSMMFNMIRSHI